MRLPPCKIRISILHHISKLGEPLGHQLHELVRNLAKQTIMPITCSAAQLCDDSLVEDVAAWL
jgi:hypothetical protein